MRLVIVLGLYSGGLLFAEVTQLLLGLLQRLRKLLLLRGLALALGRIGGVFLRLWRLILRLLGLLELVPLLLHLGELVVDLPDGERGRLMEGQLLLGGGLLPPPLLEVGELLGGRLDLAGVDPRHVLLDVSGRLPHVLHGVGHALLEAGPGLEFQRALLHGAQQRLEPPELGLVVGLGLAALVHEVLQLRRHLRDLLPLRLGRDLHDLLALELVAAAVYGCLELVLQPGEGLDLRLLGVPRRELPPQGVDVLLGERRREVVLPFHRQLLVVLFLLLLHHYLGLLGRRRLRLVRVGLGGVVRLGLRLGALLLGGGVARVAVTTRCAVGRVGLRPVGGIRLLLLNRDVHPIQLLDGGRGALQLEDPTGLERHRRRDLRQACHVVVLPLALQQVLEARHGVLGDEHAVLEDLHDEVLLRDEGQLLLAAQRGPCWVQDGQVLLPAAVQRDDLHRVLVLGDVGEEDLPHTKGRARVGRHERRAQGRGLLAVEVLAEGHLLAFALLDVVAQDLLDLGHPPSAADDLDVLEVRQRRVGRGQRLLDRVRQHGEHVGAHLLELLALDLRNEVRVLKQRLHDERRHLVSAQRGLGLLRLCEELPQSAGVRRDAVGELRVLFLEFFEHDLRDLEVHQVASDPAVGLRAEHGDDRRGLALHHAGGPGLKLHDRGLGLPGAEVVKQRQLGAVLLGRIIYRSLHREGGALVHQRQHPQAGDLRGRRDRLALPEGRVGGHGDYDVAHLDDVALAGRLRHLLAKEKKVAQHLLAMHDVAAEFERGGAPRVVVTEIEGIEHVTEAEIAPPPAAWRHILRRVVPAERGMEEHRHFCRGLALVRQRVVTENPDLLVEGHRRGGLPLGVRVQHNFQRLSLPHDRDL
mmetsp:Transcript_14857/g.44092  ORF Transcript_14857/g.44092 Transcript_14857/m.44092 type:complete len:866 (+) Transcript_14857:254-2851(+)